MMQTILGSGGAIGKELAKVLTEYTTDIRLVSRNPVKVNATDELISADLLNPLEVESAVKGSSIVYATVGFPYNLKVWKSSWMSSVNYKHSFTFTPDAGRATALLGNSEDAFNQIWHLPTAANPMTGKEWIEAIAAEMGVKPRNQRNCKIGIRKRNYNCLRHLIRSITKQEEA